VLQVEARQRLRRDEQPRAVRQRLEVPQEPARQLSVSVAHEPDLRHPARRVPEHEVAGGAGHRQVMFLHTLSQLGTRKSERGTSGGLQFRVPSSAFRVHVTKIVTTSCGPATNLTRCPRPSSTSASDSRSSARTRCALLTPSPKRQAPAALRLVAL